jgi:hypothetical protein
MNEDQCPIFVDHGIVECSCGAFWLLCECWNDHRIVYHIAHEVHRPLPGEEE